MRRSFALKPFALKRQLAAVILGLSLGTGGAALADNNLPDLGGASGGIVSPEQEYALGQQWLRLYRSRVPTSADPLINDYVEQLLRKLALHSQLTDRRLSVVVVENPTMNAFAVPGGVVGVHTGLFLYAESENQMASVLAHELGHLSQRHFARGVEAQKTTSMGMMAAQLASLVLAATAGADAGLAALSASQALALDKQLRFSRQNEQEADRVGMQTMVAADLDPYAVGDMFEQMLYATRFSRRPPEFLLTHPVTEKRIADARNRAQKYPKKQYPISLDFQLMRARARLHQEESPQKAVKRFRAELQGDSLNLDASRYGLALALSQAGMNDEARKALLPLLKKEPRRIAYVVASAEIEAQARNYDRALKQLEAVLPHYPQDYPLNMTYADILMKANRYTQSEKILTSIVRYRPGDPHAWYLLAEVRGLAGDILGVHKARTEYFILNGVYDRAARQINHALKLTKGNYIETALLEEKLREVQRMQEKTGL